MAWPTPHKTLQRGQLLKLTPLARRRFMLAPAAEDIEVLVDAFKGEIVFLEEAADTLASIHGIQVKQQKPVSLAPDL